MSSEPQEDSAVGKTIGNFIEWFRAGVCSLLTASVTSINVNITFRAAAESQSAAGPRRLLVVDGQVVERDVRRAGVPRGPPPSWAGPVIVARVITAQSQVARQRDLHLKPHLSALREGEEGGE